MLKIINYFLIVVIAFFATGCIDPSEAINSDEFIQLESIRFSVADFFIGVESQGFNTYYVDLLVENNSEKALCLCQELYPQIKATAADQTYYYSGDLLSVPFFLPPGMKLIMTTEISVAITATPLEIGFSYFKHSDPDEDPDEFSEFVKFAAVGTKPNNNLVVDDKILTQVGAEFTWVKGSTLKIVSVLIDDSRPALVWQITNLTGQTMGALGGGEENDFLRFYVFLIDGSIHEYYIDVETTFPDLDNRALFPGEEKIVTVYFDGEPLTIGQSESWFMFIVVDKRFTELARRNEASSEWIFLNAHGLETK